MNIQRIVARALPAVVVAGCTLYSDVSITPLYVSPPDIERGADLQQMLRKADFLRAIELTKSIESRQSPSASELSALGEAELTSGRYDAARKHLRAALDLNPFRTTYASVAWDLSQLEYLNNNFDSSLDWAKIAIARGMNIKKWHLDYMEALANRRVYEFPGKTTAQLAMRVDNPDVPRVEVRLNDQRAVSAVVDTGAVISIVSKRYAELMSLKPIGDFEGTFYGLLGEPIAVRFAVLDSVEIGDMVVRSVPVAIMPDEKMKFLVSDKKEYHIDFLLGANFLKEFRIELNFRKDLIEFTKLSAADRNPSPDQNMFIEGFRPQVRSTVNRHGWFMFVLDTGSEVTFLNEAQLAVLPIPGFQAKAHNARLQGLGGSMKRGAKVENVEVGVDKFAGVFRTLPMYASSNQDRSVGIIGENFLKNFRVVIDFGRMRVDLFREGINATQL
ncbi:MAG: hypothetical protein JWO97_4256 [Acidobacteria bacterium]|nr:hypothetical protein [Acidobacteriota bacterium]